MKLASKFESMRPDQGVVVAAQVAGRDHQVVITVMRDKLRNVERIGDDTQPLELRETLCECKRGGAGIEKHGHAILHELRCAGGKRHFRLRLDAVANLKRLLFVEPGKNCATVDAARFSQAVQKLEITTNRFFGDAEGGREVKGLDALLLAEMPQNFVEPGLIEHT